MGIFFTLYLILSSSFIFLLSGWEQIVVKLNFLISLISKKLIFRKLNLKARVERVSRTEI